MINYSTEKGSRPMKKTTRLLAAILAVASVSVFAASCAEKADKDDAGSVTTAEIAETMPEEEIDPRLLLSDNIPDDVKFGGDDFVVLCQEGHEDDIYIEEMSGDIVEDTIFQRNQEIAGRFDIKFVDEFSDYSSMSTKMKNSITAGDDYYDLILHHCVQAGLDSLNGLFANWYDVEYMDFTAPWYPQFSIKDLTINNRMYITVSDLTISCIENTYCMYYDKVYADNWNITDLYTTVNNGEWTIDKLIELTKDVYEDTNGNGKSDKEDFFGYNGNCRSNAVTYLWAFNQPIIEIDDEYNFEIVFNSQKTMDILDKVRVLFWEDQGSYVSDEHGGGAEAFKNGHGIFLTGTMGNATGMLREYENDYGIIPYPKWDEAQDAYRTMSDGNFDVVLIPITVNDTAKVGAVAHALGCYSYKYVIPNYYDIALKVKGTRDEESVAILDMILDGRVIDFAYCYDAWKGFAFKFESLTFKAGGNFASTYKSNEKAATRHYQKVLEMFTNIEG